MTDEQIRAELLQALAEIAPEVDAAKLSHQRTLRAQVDLDSADWLNFLVAVGQHFGVEIPDTDVSRLTSLDRFVAWLGPRTVAAR